MASVSFSGDARPSDDNDEVQKAIKAMKTLLSEDYLPFGMEIPSRNLIELHEKYEINVRVMNVYSPSHIWLQEIGEQYKEYERLTAEMIEYYKDSSKGYLQYLPLAAVRVGYYCCAIAYNSFVYRARIVRILDSVKVQVFLVDFGITDVFELSRIRPLLSKWGILPKQALRVRLSGIKPKYNKKTWDIDLATLIWPLVEDEFLIARLIALDESAGAFRIALLSKKRECLNWHLANIGKVERDKNTKQEQRNYQLPEFVVLENGLTPSHKEIQILHSLNMNLEDIPEYVKYCIEGGQVGHFSTAASSYIPLSFEVFNKYKEIEAIDEMTAYLYLKAKLAAATSSEVTI